MFSLDKEEPISNNFNLIFKNASYFVTLKKRVKSTIFLSKLS